MTNADRDSAARLLNQIIARLEGAEKTAEESAERRCKEHPTTNQHAHQLGALEQIVRNEVHALRSVVAGYLTPAVAPPRGPRRRR